jgi:HK97 family phage major capsid protein/HK97 family phage prohead protease
MTKRQPIQEESGGTPARVFPEKLTPLERAVDASTLELRDDGKKLSFAASSETPVERWFGNEVLSHAPGAVRLDRVTRGAMPLLFNHNWDDPIGMIDGARLENKRLVVDAHFFDTSRAAEVREMVAGGLKNVSLGYRLHVVEEDKDDETYTARDWEPHEVSIVTIPADPTVGIGRALGQELAVRMLRVGSTGPEVFVPQPPALPAAKETRMSQDNSAADQNAAPEVRIEAGKDQPNLVEFETKRKAAIRSLCIANKLDERYERSWIESGADMGQVADDIIQILAERGKTNPQSVTLLGMGKTDVRRYSLLRALRAAINNDWKDAGLELECNNELSKRLDKSPRSAKSFFVPLDVLMRDIPGSQKRDMTVAGVSGSNYLVSTDNMPGNFIDLLRNTSVGLRMGVQRLSGLKGNVTIPKMTAGNTAYWLSDETTQITESQPTIGQLSLAPKNVAALTELSHQLMVQSSPDVENLVLQSIARDIGLAVDVGILRGSGASGQPTGIATTGSIGAFTGTSLAAAGLLDAQADVAAANALNPGCGYVTTPAVAALLMARPELPTTGTTRMWKGNMAEGSIFDFPAMSSAQMSSATMLFGWWPSVLLAEWGVLELMVNPFSDFTRGLTAVRGWYTCDVGVRYAGAWSYATSIT